MGAVFPVDLTSCTAKDLREELGRRGLPKSGKRALLIQRLEEALAAEVQAEAMECRSSSSHASLVPRFSATSQRAQEAAKRAELKARENLLEERERFIREEMELKMKRERLQLHEEIALTEARERH